MYFGHVIAQTLLLCNREIATSSLGCHFRAQLNCHIRVHLQLQCNLRIDQAHGYTQMCDHVQQRTQ